MADGVSVVDSALVELANSLRSPIISVSYIISKYRIVNADVRMHHINGQYTSLREWFDMSVKKMFKSK